jgi:hypothetical protein
VFFDITVRGAAKRVRRMRRSRDAARDVADVPPTE